MNYLSNLNGNDSYSTCKNMFESSQTYFRYFTLFVFSVIMSISIPGNSILCLYIYRNSSMYSPINLLLASLALCDLLIAFFCVPFDAVVLITNGCIFSSTMCKLHSFIRSVLIVHNIIILLMIALDRYTIIVKKQDKLALHDIKLLILSSFVQSVIVSCPPFLGWGNYGHCLDESQDTNSFSDISYSVFNFSASFVIPCSVMMYIYVIILASARHLVLRTGNYPVGHFYYDHSERNWSQVYFYPRHLRVDLRFKMNTLSTIITLFLIALICRFPFYLTNLLWTIKFQSTIYSDISILCILYANSAVNPIIYAWKIRKYRDACYKSFPESWNCLSKIWRSKLRAQSSDIYHVGLPTAI